MSKDQKNEIDEAMETDAVPYDIPSRGQGTGSSGRRAGDRQEQHCTGGLEDALNLLAPGDRASVQSAVDNADDILKKLGQPPLRKGRGPSSKAKHIPSGATKGAPQVHSFNNCSNVHIGDNNVVTHNYYGDQGKSEGRTKQQHIHADIERLQGDNRELTQGDISKLADHVGSVWRRLDITVGHCR